jgi:hypothetical protein
MTLNDTKFVIPTKAGIQEFAEKHWMPAGACPLMGQSGAGMTVVRLHLMAR